MVRYCACEIRRMLNLKEGDKLLFIEQDGKSSLERFRHSHCRAQEAFAGRQKILELPTLMAHKGWWMKSGVGQRNRL